MDDVSKVSACGRNLLIDGGSGPERDNYVRLIDTGPYIAALPQGKVDRVVVLQAAILKCAKCRDLSGLKEPGKS